MEGAAAPHQRPIALDAVRDMRSPRLRAIFRATNGREKPLRKFHGYGYSQDLVAAMRVKFKKLKEEVNSQLGAFAGELVRMLERSSEGHPDWSRSIEDLLVVAWECAEMSPEDLWNKCGGIVQNLDDRRQELPMGPLKQLHTRMLYILTRCTRLSQFQKEGAYPAPLRDQVPDGDSVVICQICDAKIPKMYVDEHLRICTVVDRCDRKSLNVNERLERVAEILGKVLEACSPKNSHNIRISQESRIYSTTSLADEHEELSYEPLISTDGLGSDAESDASFALHEKVTPVPKIICKTQCAPTPDLGVAPTSSGSMSPASTLSAPRQIGLLLTGWEAFSEFENLQQIHKLWDLSLCIANMNSISYGSLEYLHTRLQDLRQIVEEKRVEALIVETFGRRIGKLLREKYAFILRQISDGKLDTSTLVDEDGSTEGDSIHTSGTTPLSCSIKDSTTIEDFEIIKPISRGAFGRVFLAKKRKTGDLFAIKVLKKADMIRKNAMESILAEHNFLISVRNPFVVRFLYSFTCRENLYLAMEYLNGGDLYSLLRNLGCLDEELTRIYMAEVVLALEYLHSLNLIHRDLKPDNLIIAHDGHIKLTDFGLSKVGLINSTDNLTGPDVSVSALIVDHEKNMTKTERNQMREHRQKQEVVGTPVYLAPEILLGMAHGPTADWWSVGIIMFELLVGIPPFNAEHPQKVFDNIMNRDILWPQVPQEMSLEAYDLINRLLTENPVQRLGATGVGEVKHHPFFKDINWDMLAEKKAAFIPSTDGDNDTSYFTSRHTWSSSDANVYMSS